MEVAIVVAVIALVGTIGNVLMTYYFNVRSESIRTQREAETAFARHRSILQFAATELRDRLVNVLDGQLLDAYASGDPNRKGPAETGLRDEAVKSTLFRICQYLGSVEIVRRYARTSAAEYSTKARALYELTSTIGTTFATDRYADGPSLMLWRESQRAIGELMITRDDGSMDTIGYGSFLKRFDEFAPFIHRTWELMNSGRPVDEWPERARAIDLRESADKLLELLKGLPSS